MISLNELEKKNEDLECLEVKKNLGLHGKFLG